MKIIYTILLFILSFGVILSQNKVENQFMPDSLKELVIIQPTGEMRNDLPEMKVLADSTLLYKNVSENIKNSFITEFLDFYFLAQIYLINNHKLDSLEPAYLALTENQGGFAKFGFVLKKDNKYLVKKDAAYVDITVGNATANQNKLMSFTQLYPHELGHVFYHLLSPEDTTANNTKNVDMHFFSVTTDYSTAFNEGFAEHIENVSRANEKNENIRAGIFSDIDIIANKSKQAINGFERDFKYPFRLGYYKASMLNWFQKYEDYKRYEHAFNGDIRYKNATLKLSNTEDQLSYRNSGARLNKSEKRNLVQMLSTEGVVSSFFTHLSTSNLVNHYLDPSFYNNFIYSTNAIVQNPKALYTPLQNQFIKYIYVLHNFVVFNNSSKSQLNDFIDGYIQSFPSEKDEIKKIFKESTGLDYSNQLPPPVWILVKNYSHRLLTFDPFDAITIPFYTFDLNASEIEDLQTIEGVSRDDANKIIKYRNENGFFTSIEQIKNVPNLSSEVVDKIALAELEDDYLESSLENFESDLSINDLILKPLQYVISRALLYFLCLFGIIYFLSIRKEKPTILKTITLLVKYLTLWLLLVLLELVSIFLFGQSYLLFLAMILFITILAFLIYRKKKVKRLRTFAFIGLMSFSILISII